MYLEPIWELFWFFIAKYDLNSYLKSSFDAVLNCF